MLHQKASMSARSAARMIAFPRATLHAGSRGARAANAHAKRYQKSTLRLWERLLLMATIFPSFVLEDRIPKLIILGTSKLEILKSVRRNSTHTGQIGGHGVTS